MNSIVGCSGDAITPGVVVFDPVAFAQLYPAFSNTLAAVLNNNFVLAQLFLSNTCCSVVADAPTRSTLLNLIVAFITLQLNGNKTQPAQTSLVGRISEASEGTVRGSLQFASSMNDTEAFWSQNQYGEMFWQASLVYRLATYVPPCDLYEDFGPWNSGWPL